MNTAEQKLSTELLPLTYAWLTLIALTLASLFLGQWFSAAPWLPPLVAAIIWFKGVLVAQRFIEIGLTHAFIRRVVYGFVAFTPLTLVAVTYFGAQLAGWASL
ncbi:MAG: hypothetical protein U0989_04395 [Azonexus sp.]|nr:hypothetical protein [Azonexus sp.]MDP3637681.1 hypothetical protein [Azonexus sp.]MDZ4313987.1 hypothetical protein [Azonexus sp.]